MGKWYKLDNAAKIFPSVTNKSRTNVFRLSATLTEEVDPALLEEAQDITLKRFSSLKVRLKKGLFWYYLDENKAKCGVYPESPFICPMLPRKAHNNYLFKLSYYKKRINLEIFHSLTDGSGGLEFLKSIVYHYLMLKGYDIDTESLILTDEIENIYEEDQDSFLKNYDKRLKNNVRDMKAMKISGTEYEDSYRSLIIASMNVSDIKSVTSKYNVTITELFTAVSIYAATTVPSLWKNRKNPFQVFIPVNLRNYFPSKTLRNFSLFIASGTYLTEELKFEDVLEMVKTDFANQLTKEKMHKRIVANVMLEKNIFLRITPLVIKELVLRIGYNAWGDSLNSITISNLGNTKLPQDMMKYFKRLTFVNGASKNAPINIAAMSYNGILELTFSSMIKERDYQRAYIRMLTDLGINITVETNHLEIN